MLAKAAVALAALPAAGVAAAAYSIEVEPRWLRRRRLHVRLAGLPESLDGLRVLQISDIHYRPNIPITSSLLRRTKAWCDEVEPDLVCLTGDFVENDADIEVLLDELCPLRARYGCFAVFGNHDFSRKLDPPEPPAYQMRALLADMLGRPWYRKARTDPQANDVDHIARAMCERGVRVLRNANVRLNVPGGPLYVAGVDDPQQRRHDVGLALRGVPPGAPLLLLAHSHDVVPSLQGAVRPLLILSGHTHGGQIRFPGLKPLLTHTRLHLSDARGLLCYAGLKLYVTTGLGASIPVRFGCRPEIALLTLQRG